MLELGPDGSHVVCIHDPIVIGEDAMHGDAPLIPIFLMNFRVHIAVEHVPYALDIISTIGPHLCPTISIHLQMNKLCRDCQPSQYQTT